jgi:hypothetical protein
MDLRNLFSRREESPRPAPIERDGSCPASAVVVDSVREEYQWMLKHFPGYMLSSQKLVEPEGKPFDVMTWHNGEGMEVAVYFDISSFFGRLTVSDH